MIMLRRMLRRWVSPVGSAAASSAAQDEAQRLIALGDSAEAEGDLRAACEQYRKAVKVAPGYARAHLNLGVGLEATGDADGALKAYEAALAIEPANANAGYNLGKLLYTRGELQRAQALLHAALEHKPGFAEAQVVLASVYESQENADAAAVALEVALELRPEWAGAWLNYGMVLKKLGRKSEAELALTRVMTLEPDNADAAYELADLLYARGALQEAEKYLLLTLRHKPQFPEAHVAMGNVCKSKSDFRGAENCYRKAIALEPDYVGAHYMLGDILYHRGNREKALEAFERALSLRPDFLEARWAHMMAQIPAMYSDPSEVTLAHAAFLREAEALQDWADANSTPSVHEVVGMIPPFYFAYSQENNRDLLARHGELCVRLMDDWLRALAPIQAHRSDRDRLEIGIVSAHIFDHSVWNAIIKGWIRHLDTTRFSLSLFHLGTKSDRETDFARSRVAHFEGGERPLEQWVQSIVLQQPDVLIYAEIGMDPTALKLASLRLAPVQAATWGHPETTGLPTMDYYLSAEYLEPAGAEAHYTESLIKLPGLGVCYRPLPVPSVVPDLKALAIDDKRPLLLSPGTPFKYSPRRDWVYVEIARRVGDCQLIFFFGRDKDLSEMLRLRLSIAFSAAGLDFERQVKFTPWLNRAEFYGLMRCAHVFLDPIGFSGFNTAIQAVECGLPIVTREGSFMRGRLASGILDRMGLSDLVAKSEDEYIDLAVELASNADYRKNIRDRMDQARTILYDDVEPVRALEDFLVKSVINARTLHGK